MIGGVTSGGAATAPNGCSNLMIQLEVDQSESDSVIYQALRGRGVSKRQDGGFRLGMAPFSFFPFLGTSIAGGVGTNQYPVFWSC